jgi:hypothetical protein
VYPDVDQGNIITNKRLEISRFFHDLQQLIKSELRKGDEPMLKLNRRNHKNRSLSVGILILFITMLFLPVNLFLAVKVKGKSATESENSNPIFINPVNLGPIVNSSVEDSGPCISADGLSLYFQSRRPGGLGGNDIWVTTRKATKVSWTIPINLGPPFNTTSSDQNPQLSVDGLELYFTSDRPGGSGNLDIFVATRKTKDETWGQAVNLGPKVNSATAEIDPSISANGLTLYFSDAIWQQPRPGGVGGPDIWMTTRKSKDAPWDPAVNLGPTINTPGTDVAPSISIDGLTLYFASNRGRSKYNQPDLWMTTRKSTDAPWGLPINLGPMVNNPSAGEWGPNISRDGSTLYFVSIDSVSGSGHGKADLWQTSSKENRPRE